MPSPNFCSRLGIVLLFAALPFAAHAADIAHEAPQSDEPAGYSDRIDFAFGVALTTNYLSDGVSQSDNGPAMQGYGEASSGIFYSGLWFSNVTIDTDRFEIDLYAGIRPQFGPIALDFGYTRYLYDDTGDCCGEWIAKADLELNSALTLQAQTELDPQARIITQTLGATLALGDSLEFSAAIEEDVEDDATTNWNAGLKVAVGQTVSVDLRYHDSDFDEERYVFTMAFDASTAQ